MNDGTVATRAWMDRRRFLAGVSGVAGAAALAALPAGRATAAQRPAHGGCPFTLGVASGDPTATGVVLWTRLVPRLFEPGGGMPARRVTVDWQVARDERFRHVVRDGIAWAIPELGHSVHVEVGGLRPDREWFYRFRHGRDQSPVGRTRTVPPVGAGGGLAFAFASCQAWDHGYYPSYRHMAREDLDLVLHLGDYVYEGRILDAAGRLFYSRGIQAVGMDALRAESGVSLKRLYRLFPSKESIVEQVLLRQHETWNGWVSAAIAEAGNPRDRLLAIYEMLARWFDRDGFRGCIFINSFGELGAVAPRIAELVRTHKAGFQARVADLVADAGAPAALAPRLSILAEGAQTTAAIAGTAEAAEHARTAAEILIDDALRHPQAA